MEVVGYAIVLVPLLVALWARATGRERLFRWVGGALLFVVACVVSLFTFGLMYAVVNGGGVGVLIAGIGVSIGLLLSFLLWVRFLGVVRSKPEPKYELIRLARPAPDRSNPAKPRD